MTTVQQWSYQGRNDKGKVVKGRMEAPNEASVVSRMRGMGLTPVSVDEAGRGTGLQRDIVIPGFEKKSVGLKPLAIAARQLATMVGAGLPLLKALNILADQTEDKPLARVLDDVRGKVESGMALSDSLALHPDAFPPLMVHLVRSGETGGFLDQALRSIAKTFESELKLRSKIKSAMTYPVIVLVIALLAVAMMLIFIVPIFKQMFANLGGELPLPTQVLVVLSENMIWIGPVVVVLGVAGWVWWGRHKHDDAVRQRVDPVLLKLPVFGLLMRKLAIARFTRNLATMVGAGVPILRALDIVAETSGNWVVKSAILDIRENVRTGRPIAEAMARHEVFPPMVAQMIAVGEDAGAMETMLVRIADSYDDEVDAMAEQLTALVEPIMIVVLGVIIGGMVIALYMPMFSIYDQIQ